jgi:IS30 family transposase
MDIAWEYATIAEKENASYDLVVYVEYNDNANHNVKTIDGEHSYTAMTIDLYISAAWHKETNRSITLDRGIQIYCISLTT